MVTEARKHLIWATDRALKYDNQEEAIASFLSDVSKRDDTGWITVNPASLGLLIHGYRLGSEAFKEVMLGFNV